MRTWTRTRSNEGFTLLEVMVSVAILAVTIIPMLLLREQSYNKAVETKAIRTAQELAQKELSWIAMEVRTGEGADDFEGFDGFSYDYRVTLYDFGAGMEADLDQEKGIDYSSSALDDKIYAEEDAKSYGDMVMRHVELTVFYPCVQGDLDAPPEEYVIDTYIPLLLTQEQYDYKMQTAPEEP